MKNLLRNVLVHILLVVLFPYLLWARRGYNRETVQIFRIIRAAQREVVRREERAYKRKMQVALFDMPLPEQEKLYQGILCTQVCIAYGRNRRLFLLAKELARLPIVHELYRRDGGENIREAAKRSLMETFEQTDVLMRT